MKASFILLALTAAVGGFAAATPDNEARGDYDYYKPKCHKDKCLKNVRKYPWECKKYQIVYVTKYKPTWTKTTKTITYTAKPYCPKKHHDDDYKPPKKHYVREPEAEAEPEAQPEAQPEAEPEAEAGADDYKPPPYVTAYPTYCPSYCPSTDRYASACSCIGYPKTTKYTTSYKTFTKTKYTKTITTPPCPKRTKHYKDPKKDY